MRPRNGSGVREPISESEVVSDAHEQSDDRVVLQAHRKMSDRAIGGQEWPGKAVGKDGWMRQEGKVSKAVGAESSLCERPISHRPRRLADWLNPTGDRKVHSLVDKIYKMKNLEMAWERVRANRGAGGVDGESIDDFEANLADNLARLHAELKHGTYQPQPVRRHLIPKPGPPDQKRPLGIPTVYDRVCQQAILNRIEPIFEPVFDDASFGYRRGRSTKDALRKMWREIRQGREWIVDADLRDFFGSAPCKAYDAG